MERFLVIIGRRPQLIKASVVAGVKDVLAI